MLNPSVYAEMAGGGVRLFGWSGRADPASGIDAVPIHRPTCSIGEIKDVFSRLRHPHEFQPR